MKMAFVRFRAGAFQCIEIYAPSGSVAVIWKAPKTLCIRDTGIGIAPEDLPRIFLKRATQDITEEAIKKPVVLDLSLPKNLPQFRPYDYRNSSLESRTVIRIQLERKK